MGSIITGIFLVIAGTIALMKINDENDVNYTAVLPRLILTLCATIIMGFGVLLILTGNVSLNS
jgi:hypothetical protein